MQRINTQGVVRLLLTTLVCFASINIWAKTEINVETAGTLSSILTSTDSELKVTGYINGSDIKYIRSLVNNGKVVSLDWSEVHIVAGGEAYTESYTTKNDVIGEKMLYGFSKLVAITLPATITSIQNNAFANTGLKKIEIPNSVVSVGEDAFAYGCCAFELEEGETLSDLF